MYIFFDTETGGIGLDKSLLTVFFLVTDDKLQTIEELSLFLKPDDGIYRVTGEALSINHINLEQHDSIAVTYSDGARTLYNFLNNHSKRGAIKLIPVGHNCGFDIAQINDKLVKRPTWENFVSYRPLDTQVVGQYLILIGAVDGSRTSGSLKSLGEYFLVSSEELGYAGTGLLHDARYDTLLTRAVLRVMKFKGEFAEQATTELCNIAKNQ